MGARAVWLLLESQHCCMFTRLFCGEACCRKGGRRRNCFECAVMWEVSLLVPILPFLSLFTSSLLASPSDLSTLLSPHSLLFAVNKPSSTTPRRTFVFVVQTCAAQTCVAQICSSIINMGHQQNKFLKELSISRSLALYAYFYKGAPMHVLLARHQREIEVHWYSIQ